jgi:hypothetical protein
MPSRVRKISRNMNVGEKPAMKLQAEYHKIEIISGARRPRRSAIQPEAIAPTNRINMVSVPTNTTSVRSALNSLAIGTIRTRKTVKSNASKVQPGHAAMKAYYWSLVGSRHHGPDADELAECDVVKLPFVCPSSRKISLLASLARLPLSCNSLPTSDARWRLVPAGDIPVEELPIAYAGKRCIS